MKLIEELKSQFEGIKDFFARYSLLCIIAVIAFILSAIVPAWNFVPYGIAKTCAALVTGLFIRNVFLTTINKYIKSGSFKTDFFACSNEVKICVSAGVACVFFLGACICFG